VGDESLLGCFPVHAAENERRRASIQFLCELSAHPCAAVAGRGLPALWKDVLPLAEARPLPPFAEPLLAPEGRFPTLVDQKWEDVFPSGME
jgi:hypothetical protein